MNLNDYSINNLTFNIIKLSDLTRSYDQFIIITSSNTFKFY